MFRCILFIDWTRKKVHGFNVERKRGMATVFVGVMRSAAIIVLSAVMLLQMSDAARLDEILV